MINRRKKNVRMRGSKSHGYGSKKKHRGAGSRGGRGLAGTGKRADTKRPSFGGRGTTGRRGFHSKNKRIVRVINIDELLSKISKTKGSEINLREMGRDKLLGRGKITAPIIIKAESASEKAVQKVEKAGGKVILPEEALPEKEETIKKEK